MKTTTIKKAIKLTFLNAFRLFILFSLFNSATAIADDTALKKQWTVTGLDQPESVVFDPAHNVLIVSNINGAPLELNGQGYLSKVSLDGKIIDQHWVTQLNAPKGIAIHQDKLYVADMQTLHVIETTTGNISQQITQTEAKLLNDITIDDQGTVYVSDMLNGTIYRLENNQLNPWFQSDQLPHPNGLLWQDGYLLVGAWGQDIQSDFSTRVAGSLLRLDIESKQLSPLPSGYQLGNLDGVVMINKRIFVSDWLSGDLYQLSDNQRIKILSTNAGIADIGVYKNTVVAPMMHDGQLISWLVSETAH